MLWAQSTTKDYKRAKHKLQSISKLFISQVIIPQVMFFEPIYIPRARNTGTCIRQSDLFILRAYTGTGVSYSQHKKNSGDVLEKMQVNGLEG